MKGPIVDTTISQVSALKAVISLEITYETSEQCYTYLLKGDLFCSDEILIKHPEPETRLDMMCLILSI